MNLIFAFSLAALVAIGSTFPLWNDAGARLGFLVIVSLSGIIVGALSAMIGLGNMHDPNVIVIAVSDTLFYTWLFFWLIERRSRRES